MYKFIFSIFLLFLLFGVVAEAQQVKLGIDLVVDNDFEIFRGKRVAILSNNAGRSSRKKLTVELFVKSGKCEVVAIFAPEHGFKTWVRAGRKVKDDTLFGLPVYSLYGKNRRPERFQLNNVDMVIIVNGNGWEKSGTTYNGLIIPGASIKKIVFEIVKNIIPIVAADNMGAII